MNTEILNNSIEEDHLDNTSSFSSDFEENLRAKKIKIKSNSNRVSSMEKENETRKSDLSYFSKMNK
jgi:hypothetical protein